MTIKHPPMCSNHRRYKGMRRPICNGGKGCRACWATYRYNRGPG